MVVEKTCLQHFLGLRDKCLEFNPVAIGLNGFYRDMLGFQPRQNLRQDIWGGTQEVIYFAAFRVLSMLWIAWSGELNDRFLKFGGFGLRNRQMECHALGGWRYISL